MFKEGHPLWFVPKDQRRSKPREVCVTKVGRVWIELSNGMRCDATGRVDGGNYASPGHCHVSRSEYEYEVALQTAWSNFQQAVAKKPMPGSMTLAALKQLSTTLGV